MQSCYDCDHLKRCGESIYCMWNGIDKGVKIDEDAERGINCGGFCPKKEIDKTICKSCLLGSWFGNNLYCVHNECLMNDSTCEKYKPILEEN